MTKYLITWQWDDRKYTRQTHLIDADNEQAAETDIRKRAAQYSTTSVTFVKITTPTAEEVTAFLEKYK